MTQDRAFFDQSVTSSDSAILPQWVMIDVYSRVRLPSLYRRACEQAANLPASAELEDLGLKYTLVEAAQRLL